MLQSRELTKDSGEPLLDWYGNNIVLRCPVAGCGRVFTVSGFLSSGKRECPQCHKSKGLLSGTKKAGYSAKIEWDDTFKFQPQG